MFFGKAHKFKTHTRAHPDAAVVNLSRPIPSGTAETSLSAPLPPAPPRCLFDSRISSISKSTEAEGSLLPVNWPASMALTKNRALSSCWDFG